MAIIAAANTAGGWVQGVQAADSLSSTPGVPMYGMGSPPADESSAGAVNTVPSTGGGGGGDRSPPHLTSPAANGAAPNGAFGVVHEGKHSNSGGEDGHPAPGVPRAGAAGPASGTPNISVEPGSFAVVPAAVMVGPGIYHFGTCWGMLL